jgi:uncharacterized protein GlcG (DUF336 family)
MFSGDQGSSWTLQNSGVSNYISDIYFLNKNLGWAVTFEIEGSNSDIRSKVLKTSDGGGVWKNENYRHLNIILSTIFFKRPTKVFEDMVAGGRNAILSLPGVLPLEGGMPLIVKDQIIGAIGISGAKSNEDGIIAKAAVDFMSGL